MVYDEKTVSLTKDMFEVLGIDKDSAEHISAPSVSYWSDTWRRLRKNKLALLGFFVLGIMILMSIFGPMMFGYDYKVSDLSQANQPPSAEHLLGTDTLGRDLWTRNWVGGRVSIAIGFIAAILQVVVGVIIGALSGYIGGKFDMFIMRVVDVLIAIPYLVWVTLLMLVTGAGIVPMILALTLTGWLGMARMVRGQVLQMKNEDYVLSAISLGAGSWRVILKHMIPNTIGIIMVNLTFAIPGAMFSEAFLSFIGIGISSPMTSWGQLISMGLKVMNLYPYQLVWPCVFISATMLSLQMIGDGLRDALDPKLRR